MKVRLKTIMAGPSGSHLPGDTLDLDEKTAVDLVEGGFAEKLQDKSTQLKAEFAETSEEKSDDKSPEEDEKPKKTTKRGR